MSFISSITSALGLNTPASMPQVAAPAADPNIAAVRILSINDFHGQIPDSDAKAGDTPIGGAATMAAYVQRERAANPNGTVFVSAGDMLGASPPVSTLLRHHSTVATLNAMGLDIATLGNHEFDGGFAEAIRVIYGDKAYAKAAAQQGIAPGKKSKRRGMGAKVDAAAGQRHVAAARGKKAWPGSPFPWISANVVDAKTKQRILPPYVIKNVNGVKVAFIGAVTKDLKNVTVAKVIPNIVALDPIKTINKLVPEIRAKGVKTMVVMIHEGGEADEHDPTKLKGPIVELAKKLDPEIDAIVSAHSHEEYATTLHGKQVVQAGSYGKALGVVELNVDRRTGQVVTGASRLVRNDERGIAPDATIARMVNRFSAAVAPRTERVITNLPGALTREASASGETALGSIIADAQRSFAKTDIAFMNNGGVRQDILKGGKVTWGTLFGVQPFGNVVTRLSMRGSDIKAVLEQQFSKDGAKILQVSGMTVHIDMTKPLSQRVVSVKLSDGRTLDPSRTYTVAANSFLADGGDGFTMLKRGKKKQEIGPDIDALVKYLESGAKISTKPPGRIVLDAGALPSDNH